MELRQKSIITHSMAKNGLGDGMLRWMIIYLSNKSRWMLYWFIVYEKQIELLCEDLYHNKSDRRWDIEGPVNEMSISGMEGCNVLISSKPKAKNNTVENNKTPM